MASQDKLVDLTTVHIRGRLLGGTRVQRKLILQLARWASCNQHLLARKSFLLARKEFFMSRMKK